MRPRVLLLLLAALALAGCKSVAACRPNTLFLSLSLDAALAAADTIVISVSDGTSTLSATSPYHGGKNVEVDFPSGRYPTGKKITLVVVVRKQAAELGRATLAGVTLPKSCGTFTVAIKAAGGDMSGGGGGDGGDGGALVDLAGADLTGAPIADLAGVPKLPNGSKCASGDLCLSTFCVDGYCCAVACAGQCQACDIPSFEGQCMPVTSGQPHGARGQCLGQDAGVCAGQCGTGTISSCIYPGPATPCASQTCTGSTKYLATGCNQGGNCNPQSTVTCSQGCSGNNCLGACTTDTQCANATPSTPYCDTNSGVCTAKKPQGHTCGGGTECTSTYCVDGYCCNAPCGGDCQSCKGIAGVAPAGTCAAYPSGNAVATTNPTRHACINNGASCGGSCNGGADCVYTAVGTLCGSYCHFTSTTAAVVDKCDSSHNCTSTACAYPTCSAAATTASSDCNGSRSCTADSECASGHCLGGFCCGTCAVYPNTTCDSAGTCNCTPTCGGGDCGPDGCGSSCDTCTNGIDAICCGQTCCQGNMCTGVGGC